MLPVGRVRAAQLRIADIKFDLFPLDSIDGHTTDVAAGRRRDYSASLPVAVTGANGRLASNSTSPIMCARQPSPGDAVVRMCGEWFQHRAGCRCEERLDRRRCVRCRSTFAVVQQISSIRAAEMSIPAAEILSRADPSAPDDAALLVR